MKHSLRGVSAAFPQAKDCCATFTYNIRGLYFIKKHYVGGGVAGDEY